jgi:hypothetical protein
MIYLFPLIIILSGCSTVNYKSLKDYYNDRLREDSINWGPNSKNNILDSQDGSTYYNRSVEFFGASY